VPSSCRGRAFIDRSAAALISGEPMISGAATCIIVRARPSCELHPGRARPRIRRTHFRYITVLARSGETIAAKQHGHPAHDRSGSWPCRNARADEGSRIFIVKLAKDATTVRGKVANRLLQEHTIPLSTRPFGVLTHPGSWADTVEAPGISSRARPSPRRPALPKPYANERTFRG
jgi:hypothetical protein